jgi:DNA-binding NarL/FixJ family response regulator
MRAPLPSVRGMRRVATAAASVAKPRPTPELRCAVAMILDGLGIAACVYGADGRELHRSTRMHEILASTRDAASLLEAIRTLACERSIPLHSSLRATASDPPDLAAGAAYLLRSVALPPGAVGPGPVVVVEIERSGPALPGIDELIARCGLTHREAEVALLLALGGSDRDIARQLERSPHTVRKHIEHIFDKLRLHSRKALMLRLSRKSWASPEREED